MISSDLGEGGFVVVHFSKMSLIVLVLVPAVNQSKQK